MINRELIAKDYVLYVVRYFSAMQTWTKKDIIREICRKIGEAKEDVVRCKNCKHRTLDFFGGHCCRLHKGLAMVTDDSFCSYGERRCE